MRHVVIVGPQGAGKGAQAERIAAEFNLVHLSTGDVFRELMQADSVLAGEVRSYYDAGNLVPDELTAQVLFHALDEAALNGVISGALFDGYPRNQAQAAVLDEQIANRGESLVAIVHLDVPRDVLLKRIQGRGRADDNPDALERRLSIYYAETEPLIDFWRQRGIVISIDGDQTIEDVYADVRGGLADVLTSQEG